jgi:hypothetical protein
VVFAALFLAFLTLQPVLSGYEPFAALFSLHGTTLQWFLLFLVLVVSLFLTEPWCTFLCPMGALEKVLQEGKRWVGQGKTRGVQGEAGVLAPDAVGQTGEAARRMKGAVRRSGASATRTEGAGTRIGGAGLPTYVAILLGLLFFGVILGVMAQNLRQGS